MRFRRDKHFTIQIEPSSVCNLNCPMCLRYGLEREASFLSFEDFKKIIEPDICRYVGIHGWGEPMLNKDLFKMIEHAESKGILTNVTTNGTLLYQYMDEVFKSGLKEIAFGIYDKNVFSEIAESINSLIKIKKDNNLRTPKTYLDITVYRDSLDQIPELLIAAKKMSIDSVILHRLFNVYGVDPSIEYITKKEENALFGQMRAMARKLNIEIFLPLKSSLPCALIKRCAFITAGGDVTPCTFLPCESMGSALETEISQILESETFTGFINGMSENAVCNECRWSSMS